VRTVARGVKSPGRIRHRIASRARPGRPFGRGIHQYGLFNVGSPHDHQGGLAFDGASHRSHSSGGKAAVDGPTRRGCRVSASCRFPRLSGLLRAYGGRNRARGAVQCVTLDSSSLSPAKCRRTHSGSQRRQDHAADAPGAVTLIAKRADGGYDSTILLRASQGSGPHPRRWVLVDAHPGTLHGGCTRSECGLCHVSAARTLLSAPDAPTLAAVGIGRGRTRPSPAGAWAAAMNVALSL
jgi:hypothetical protein